MADLKRVYAAVDEQTALSELDSFDEKWSNKYPNIPRQLFRGGQIGLIYRHISSIRRRSEP